jgi:hypothetical protein
MMNKIKIIQVLPDVKDKKWTVFFSLGEKFYHENFEFTEINSEDMAIPFISPESRAFNSFFANNKQFKERLFEIVEKLNSNKSVVFPIFAKLEWKEEKLISAKLETV